MKALMLELASIRGGALTPYFGLLVDVAIKGSLLVAAAAIVAYLLKDRSAAARHAAWTAAVVGHLALPILTLTMPQWRIPILPAPVWLDAAPVVAAQPSEPASSAPGTRATAPAAGSILGEPPAATTAGPTTVTAQITAHSPARRWPLISVLGLMWILGSALVLLRLAVGTWKVGRLAKEGDRVDDGEWLSLTQRLANRLGITRPLTLLRGDSLAVPVTWGVVYPAVLLPPDSGEWPESRRRFVLVHEMAHVKRFDALTQLIAQITVSILWFDPLVWYAVHRMRVEREHACDDYVLRDGTVPSLYAGELLEMVQSIGSPKHDRAAPAFAALAMARRSEFEGRMLAILDPRQNRHTLGRVSTAVAAVTLALLVFPLAALRPFHAGTATPTAIPAASPAAAAAKPPASTQGSRLYADNACDTAVRRKETSLVHIHSDTDDAGNSAVEFIRYGGGECSQASIIGRAVFSNDRIISLGDASYITIRELTSRLDRTVHVTSRGNGTMEFAATVNGAAVPYDETLRTWVARFMPEVLAETAVDAPQRVARDLARGGLAKVLDRIAGITNTASRRAHYEALLDGKPLTDAEYRRVSDHVARHLADSPGDLRVVLERIAAGPAKGRKSLNLAVAQIGQAQETLGKALGKALDTSRSSTDTAQLLTQYAVTDDPDMLLMALTHAKDISSDTDKRHLLTTIASGALRRKSAPLRDAYFAVVATMESDTDKRAVLVAAIPYGHADEAIVFNVFREVQQHVTSDTDKRAVLTTAVEQGLLRTSALRTAFMNAAKTIETSTDYTAVLQAALKKSN